MRTATDRKSHTEAKSKEAEESDGMRAKPPTEVSGTRLLLLLLLLLHFSRELVGQWIGIQRATS